VSKRGNSEGSLYQSGDGWRGYVWCTRPDGTRYRKYVRGTTYDEARQNWVHLREQASRGPVSSRPRHTRNTRCSAACTSSRI